MSTLNPEFVAVLRCPATFQEVREVSLRDVDLILRGGECGGLERGGGVASGVPEALAGWEAGLLREDGRGVYPVRGGVPVLLREELRELTPLERPDSGQGNFRE